MPNKYPDTVDLSAETLKATHSAGAAMRVEDHLSEAATHQVVVLFDGEHLESNALGKLSQHVHYEIIQGKVCNTKQQLVATGGTI